MEQELHQNCWSTSLHIKSKKNVRGKPWKVTAHSFPTYQENMWFGVLAFGRQIAYCCKSSVSQVGKKSSKSRNSSSSKESFVSGSGSLSRGREFENNGLWIVVNLSNSSLSSSPL